MLINRTANAILAADKNKVPWKYWTATNILSEELISSLHVTCAPHTWPSLGEAHQKSIESCTEIYETGSFETLWWEPGPKSNEQHIIDEYKGFRLYFRKGIESKSSAAGELIEIFTSSEVREAFECVTRKSLDKTVVKLCYTQEKPGWKMHVHDDHPSTCKLTFLIYVPVLPVPEDCEMGTSMYNQDATLHHRAPYVNNTGQFFVPCSKKFRRTLHGFDGKIVEDRRFILIQYLTHTDIDVDNPKIPIEYDGIYSAPHVMDYDTVDTLWRVK